LVPTLLIFLGSNPLCIVSDQAAEAENAQYCYELHAVSGFAASEVLVTSQRLGGAQVFFFALPDTVSFSARCQNREGNSPLAIHTAVFVHVLVLLAAGLALCFGESINLT